MKAYIAQSPGVADFFEIPTPEPKDDEILIKVKVAGICGTDLSIFSGDCSFIRSGEIVYPVRFGHEWSGIVEKVGKGVKDFAPGDRVFADNGVACGKCDACKKGDYNSCIDIRSVGTVKCYDGCFADYMLMPQRHVFHLPDNMSYEEGALLEPMSVALQGFNKCDLSSKPFCLILGTGAIGVSALCLAKQFGLETAIVGRKEKKLAVCKELGADYLINCTEISMTEAIAKIGKRPMLVVETSGAPSMFIESTKVAHKGATIALLGFYEQDLNGLPIDNIVFNELRICGGAGRFGAAKEVCDILEHSPVPIEKMITDRVHFNDCADRFINAKKYSSERIKTMIMYD